MLQSRKMKALSASPCSSYSRPQTQVLHAVDACSDFLSGFHKCHPELFCFDLALLGFVLTVISTCLQDLMDSFTVGAAQVRDMP